MKPRTKRQHEVFALSKTVTKVDKDIEKWARKECNDHIAFATKNRFWCTNCGKVHPTSLIKNDNVRCPSCRTKLEVRKKAFREHKQDYYVAFAEVLEGYQVIRLFRIKSFHKIEHKATVCAFETIMQFVPNDHAKVEFVARARCMGQGYPTSGNLEIRKPDNWKWYLYNPCPWKFHPLSQFKECYTKYGISHEMRGLSFLTAARVLKNGPRAETILKAKQYSLFTECENRPNNIVCHWSSIKIAIRHKFYVEDASTWFDHLDLMVEFGMDTRSPKYIFSPTLKEDHERLVKKKREIQRKQAAKAERIRLLEDRIKFEQMKSHFFGLMFKKGNMEVKVLESLQEYMEEGDVHHHCVFTNRYYINEKTLIFSALIDGKRCETVEVNLEQMKVVQSRGLQNKATTHHKAIVDLVNKNMYQIRMRMEGKQQKAG